MFEITNDGSCVFCDIQITGRNNIDLLGTKAKKQNILRDFKQYVGIDIDVTENRKLLCRQCYRRITKIQSLIKDLQNSWVHGRQTSKKTKRVEW